MEDLEAKAELAEAVDMLNAHLVYVLEDMLPMLGQPNTLKAIQVAYDKVVKAQAEEKAA